MRFWRGLRPFVFRFLFLCTAIVSGSPRLQGDNAKERLSPAAWQGFKWKIEAGNWIDGRHH
jgi:hypothetical protein